MKLTSKNNRLSLKMTKAEWLRIGQSFSSEDFTPEELRQLEDFERSMSKQNPNVDRSTEPIPNAGYISDSPLSTMPKEEGEYRIQQEDEPTGRSIQISNEGEAYEVIPSSSGEHRRTKINLIGVTQDDLREIENAPPGQRYVVEHRIMQNKIREVINATAGRFFYIGFWKTTKRKSDPPRWRDMNAKVTGFYPSKENWTKINLLDRNKMETRSALIDNIDYVRIGSQSFVIDRVSKDSNVSPDNPEGKAPFPRQALLAAREARDLAQGQEG